MSWMSTAVNMGLMRWLGKFSIFASPRPPANFSGAKAGGHARIGISAEVAARSRRGYFPVPSPSKPVARTDEWWGRK